MAAGRPDPVNRARTVSALAVPVLGPVHQLVARLFIRTTRFKEDAVTEKTRHEAPATTAEVSRRDVVAGSTGFAALGDWAQAADIQRPHTAHIVADDLGHDVTIHGALIGLTCRF